MQKPQVRLVDAISAGDIEKVKSLLVDDHINPNFCCNDDGDAPLHLAVKSGKVELAEVLIKHGKADITARYDRWQAPPINVATRRGDKPMVKLLVEKYHSPTDLPQKDGNTAVSLAELYQHKDILLILSNTKRHQLEAAVQRRDFQTIRALLTEQKVDPNFTCGPDNEDTPLHLAVKTGHLRTIQCLVDLGKADVRARAGPDGLQPVHVAAQRGDTTVLRHFVEEWGVPIEETTNSGVSALTMAQKSRRTDMIELLEDFENNGIIPSWLEGEPSTPSATRVESVADRLDRIAARFEGTTRRPSICKVNSDLGGSISSWETNVWDKSNNGNAANAMADDFGHTSTAARTNVEEDEEITSSLSPRQSLLARLDMLDEDEEDITPRWCVGRSKYIGLGDDDPNMQHGQQHDTKPNNEAPQKPSVETPTGKPQPAPSPPISSTTTPTMPTQKSRTPRSNGFTRKKQVNSIIENTNDAFENPPGLEDSTHGSGICAVKRLRRKDNQSVDNISASSPSKPSDGGVMFLGSRNSPKRVEGTFDSAKKTPRPPQTPNAGTGLTPKPPLHSGGGRVLNTPKSQTSSRGSSRGTDGGSEGTSGSTPGSIRARRFGSKFLSSSGSGMNSSSDEEDDEFMRYHTEPYCIDWFELDVGNIIGSGGFGTVHCGTHNNTPVCIKVLNQQVISPDLLTKLQNGTRKCTQLPPHPNIGKVHGLCNQQDHLAIISDYYSTGTLRHLLRTNSTLSLQSRLQIVAGVAHGMLHLTKHSIQHGNLAARNVFLLDHNMPKITDYGINRSEFGEHGDHTDTNAGDLRLKWMAPETIQKKGCSWHSDVWSFGMLLWEVLARGKEPFEGHAGVKVALAVINDGLRPSVPAGTPTSIAQLMHSCLQYQPESRPNFQTIHAQLMEIIHTMAKAARDRAAAKHQGQEPEKPTSIQCEEL